MSIKSANADTIAEAATILKDGGLVGLPTETVYGLAANALDSDAVAKIFAAKSRPAINPLIIHVPDIEAARAYVEVSEQAEALAHHFWPGPLTMILPRKEACGISDLASAGLETLAVRAPSHPVAAELLKTCGLPIAAPSANKSGTLSPTTPIHVQDSLGGAVDLILAAGACDVGLESTVVDLSCDTPVVLRPGSVTVEQISEALGVEVATEGGDAEKPKSPGLLLKHYAPDTPVRLNAIDVKEGEALLAFGSDKFMVARDFPDEMKRNLSETQDLHEAAANLFAMLKELDQCGAKGIAVMAVPDNGIGAAINDRLRRAAQSNKD